MAISKEDCLTEETIKYKEYLQREQWKKELEEKIDNSLYIGSRNIGLNSWEFELFDSKLYTEKGWSIRIKNVDDRFYNIYFS